MLRIARVQGPRYMSVASLPAIQSDLLPNYPSQEGPTTDQKSVLSVSPLRQLEDEYGITA